MSTCCSSSSGTDGHFSCAEYVLVAPETHTGYCLLIQSARCEALALVMVVRIHRRQQDIDAALGIPGANPAQVVDVEDQARRR